MSSFTVTGPDNKSYKIEAPEGATQKDADAEVYRQHGWDPAHHPEAPAPTANPLGFLELPPLADVAKGAGRFIGALPQGVLDLPEGGYQIAEHLGAPRVPESIRAPLRSYYDWTQATGAGQAGELVGGIGGAIAGTALAPEAAVPAALTRFAASYPGAATTATSALTSLLHPVEGGNYWLQKGEDVLAGTVLGRLLGRPAQQAGTNIAETANKAAVAADKADAEAVKQANRQAAAQHKADVAADKEAHRATQATVTEQHQALVDAEKAQHMADLAQHARAVADVKARNQAAETAAMQGRQAQLFTRSQVPAQTTSNWWQRTLQTIGVSDPAATRATPQAGSLVRDHVKTRLNQVVGDMHLDPHDSSLADTLSEIRTSTRNLLPPHEQASWFQPPAEEELKPLLIDPTTGRALRRTTRGLTDAAPAKPTGTFYRTVLAPLEKGPLTGKPLIDYISQIGSRAEELAREAQALPRERRVILQSQAAALRDAEDTVIGHAAGSPEQKTALADARRAYMMWSVGNDAALASRAGVATPAQLITNLTRRLGRGGRGEARYKDALTDRNSPYHDVATYLQRQLGEHTVQVPSAADVRAGVSRETVPPKPVTPAAIPTPAAVPRPPGRTPPTPQTAPPPRPLGAVPKAPRRSQRDYLRAAEHAGVAALLAPHHPGWAGFQVAQALNALRRRHGRGTEGPIERRVRERFERRPGERVPAGAAAGTVAGETHKALPQSSGELTEDISRGSRSFLRMLDGGK